MPLLPCLHSREREGGRCEYPSAGTHVVAQHRVCIVLPAQRAATSMPTSTVAGHQIRQPLSPGTLAKPPAPALPPAEHRPARPPAPCGPAAPALPAAAPGLLLCPAWSGSAAAAHATLRLKQRCAPLQGTAAHNHPGWHWRRPARCVLHPLRSTAQQKRQPGAGQTAGGPQPR